MPAVIGAIMLLVCLLLTSLAVVREREIGTLEQLMVSPLRPVELIAGKTIPFAVIGLVDLAMVTLLALLWFGVPFRGSPLLLLAGSVLYLLSGLGIGLLISTISRTQQEAFLASFLVYMPTILLSGFMFPVSSMPAVFQWLTLLNPVRHYLEIVRAIFLKGAGPAALWPQLVDAPGDGGRHPLLRRQPVPEDDGIAARRWGSRGSLPPCPAAFERWGRRSPKHEED